MYCGTPRPAPAQSGTLHPPRQVGPVETRLKSFGRVRGWVFGAWGECSEEVHSMVQRLAVAKVRQAATQPGHHPLFQSKAAQMASQVAHLRRKLSFTAVQSQARLHLDCLQRSWETAPLRPKNEILAKKWAKNYILIYGGTKLGQKSKKNVAPFLQFLI